MKKFNTLLLLFVAFATLQLNAQTRFLDEVFSEVEVTYDVPYAENISILRFPTIDTIPLTMDVYQPKNDTTETGEQVMNRPVVLYFHTGSFLPQYINGQITGGKLDSTLVEICTRLAKTGYVAIAVDYRQGWNPVSTDQDTRTSTLLQAAYRGIHDGRACVRFLRKNAIEENTYGIDTSRIVAWGQGTGGYLSLGMAYLSDYDTEIAGLASGKFIGQDLNPYVIPQIHGDIYGEQPAALNIPNHVGYSSEIHLAVNMAGALGDIEWIDSGEPPMIAFHPALDPFAPFADGPVIVPTTGDFVVNVSGSRTAVAKANAVGNNDIMAPANEEANVLNAIINAYKPIPFQFPGQSATTLGEDNCYTFLTPGPESGPWDWWNKPFLDVYIPAFNAAAGTDISADTLHNNGLLTNPDMSKEKALRYIDTVMMYFKPRAFLALDLMDPFVNTEEAIILDQEVNLKIGPNPAQEAIFIQTNANHRIQDLELYDMNGRLVRSHYNIDTNSFTLQRQSLLPGLYVVKMRFKEGIIGKKVLFE